MKAEYRIKLEQYLSSMLQAKRMLEMGILTREDYAKIDTIMAQKYGLESCNLYRGIDLQTVRKLQLKQTEALLSGIIEIS